MVAMDTMVNFSFPASSLAFIVLFSVLIRETSASKPFDATKVELTFNVVIIGTIISVAVCYLVWPTRSTKKLKYVFFFVSRSMIEYDVFLTNQSLYEDLISMPPWNPFAYC